MKGSLAKYPDSIHWRYRKQDQKGTLELTLYIRKRRIWAKIQDGRKAPWINATLPSLRKAIEEQLRSKPRKEKLLAIYLVRGAVSQSSGRRDSR
jgi:hypothetical protein